MPTRSITMTTSRLRPGSLLGRIRAQPKRRHPSIPPATTQFRSRPATPARQPTRRTRRTRRICIKKNVRTARTRMRTAVRCRSQWRCRLALAMSKRTSRKTCLRPCGGCRPSIAAMCWTNCRRVARVAPCAMSSPTSSPWSSGYLPGSFACGQAVRRRSRPAIRSSLPRVRRQQPSVQKPVRSQSHNPHRPKWLLRISLTSARRWAYRCMLPMPLLRRCKARGGGIGRPDTPCLRGLRP